MNPWQVLSDWDAPSFALCLALGGIGISAVALSAARALRRCSEPLRYGILFTGVIGLLAAPLLVALGQRFQDAIVRAAPAEVEVVRIPLETMHEFINPADAEEPEVLETTSATTSSQTVIASLLAIWMLGTLIGMARLLFGLCKQNRALIGVPWQPPYWTEELKAQLAQKLGMRKFPEVRISPAVPMPMVIGIWRPTIVLPEAAPPGWNQTQWEAVLLHEAAHIARRDHWAALAQYLAVLLFWWCPLVHLLARRLNELRERICDDCALQGRCDHFAYAELLVDSAERLLDLKTVPVPLGLLDSARCGLEARVSRLLEKERRPMTKLTLSGKLLGAGFLVAACLLTTGATALSQAPPAAQKKVQIKIVIDGKEIDLGDGKLLELIEAAQKKAGAEKGGKVVDVTVKRVEKPANVQIIEKTITFSPDGKILSAGDGKSVIVWDAATGKIIAKHAAEANALEAWDHVYGVQAKPDPRIEELVKQAEAIKPGAGAAVRKALQGSTTGEWHRAIQAAKTPMTGVPGARVEKVESKKIIIIIEDGKVRQLGEAELKKLIEKGIQHRHDGDTKKPSDDVLKAKDKALYDLLIPYLSGKDKVTPPGTRAAPSLTTKPLPPALPLPPKGVTPPTPITPPATLPVPPKAPTPPDLEALSRQLERINAELRDLRKRLEKNEK